MSELAISVSGLGKAYRIYNRRLDRLREVVSPTRAKYHEEAWVLQDLSFDLPRGTTCGLIGRNGAGKSTTLKIIAGKLRPTTGSVEVNGRVSSILELGTGFQPNLTGRENAKLNALFFGQEPWEVDARLDEILEFAELTRLGDHLLSTYSSGEKARLAFAVITIMSPEILILDEALATGDAGYAEKGKSFLRELTRKGCTTLVASHDINFLVAACDTLIWLERGKVRGTGPPHVVARDYLSATRETAFDLERPETVLLKFEISAGDPDQSYLFHCLEWVSQDGTIVGSHFIGVDDAFEECLVRSSKIGLGVTTSKLGWGPAEAREEDKSTFRRMSPSRTADKAVYLALPVPQPPEPMPVTLRLGGCNDLDGEVRVSLFINGEYRELGTFGRGEEGVLPWHRNDFSLGALMAGPSPED